jgi:hypothetical protein
LTPPQPELHLHSTVVEVGDPTQLIELAANPRIRRYLLARLSDTAALVDPGHGDALHRALLAEGYTPKTIKGITS